MCSPSGMHSLLPALRISARLCEESREVKFFLDNGAATLFNEDLDTTTSAAKDDEVCRLKKQVASLTLQHEETCENLRQDFSAKIAIFEKKLAYKDDLLDNFEKRQDDVAREWCETEGAIQDANSQLPQVLTRFGKKLYLCHEEIAARKRNYPDMTIKDHQMELELPAQIRRAPIEMEEVFSHQLRFLKAYAKEYHTANARMTTTVIPVKVPAPVSDSCSFQPVQGTSRTPTPEVVATETRKSSLTPRALPSVALDNKCPCGKLLMATDPQPTCRRHLDRCTTFQKLHPAGKSALLAKIALNSSITSSPPSDKADISCKNCNRTFSSAHTTLFINHHLKTCSDAHSTCDNRELLTPVSSPATSSKGPSPEFYSPPARSPTASSPISVASTSPNTTTTSLDKVVDCQHGIPSPQTGGRKDTLGSGNKLAGWYQVAKSASPKSVPEKGGLLGRSKYAVANYEPTVRRTYDTEGLSSFLKK